MIEHHNEAVWPGQLARWRWRRRAWALVPAGAGAAADDRRIFAVLWAFVAWAFLWSDTQHQLGGELFAWLFAIEALLLARLTVRTQSRLAARVGVGLFCFPAVYRCSLPSGDAAGAGGSVRRGAGSDGARTLGLLLLAEQPPPWWTWSCRWPGA